MSGSASRSHWRVLIGLVAPHRRAFVGLGLLMSFAAALPIAASFAMARFVDRVIDQAPVR